MKQDIISKAEAERRFSKLFPQLAHEIKSKQEPVNTVQAGRYNGAVYHASGRSPDIEQKRGPR